MPKHVVLLLATVVAFVSSRTTHGEQPSAKLSRGASASNHLGLRLLLEMDQKNDNVIISPTCITTSLGMILAGTQGETADEIQRAIDIASIPEAHAELSKLVIEPLDHDQLKLRIANQVWGAESLDCKPQFLDTLRSSYRSEMFLLDFEHHPKDAIQEVNNWVTDHTDGKIRELVNSSHVTPATRLIVTNAIFFAASWLRPFDEELTQAKPFRISADEVVDVSMMQQTGDFPVYSDEIFDALLLPYRGDRFAMCIALPHETQSLQDVEQTLLSAGVTQILRNAKPVNATISIPRFQAALTVSLKEAFRALGIQQVFEQSADLTNIASHEKLILSDVMHQAKIDVNEHGTEATATTVAFVSKSLKTPEMKFIVNRPFLFFIFDQETGAMLFLGEVNNPNGVLNQD